MFDHIVLIALLLPLSAGLLLLACNRAVNSFYHDRDPTLTIVSRDLFRHMFKAMTSVTTILFLSFYIPFSFLDFSPAGFIMSLFVAVVAGGVTGGFIGVCAGGAAVLGSKKSPKHCKIYSLGALVLCGLATLLI